MSDCDCEVPIDVPAWVPGAIAFGLSVLIAIAVIITYVFLEMERHRNFYGKEDKLSMREQPADQKRKEEMDAYAVGRCSDEILVIKSPVPPSPGTVGTKSGVKVMLRKKKPIMKTPSKPPATSVTMSQEAVTPAAINFTDVHDRTGRAFELMDLIQKESLATGPRMKRAENVLALMRHRLEVMTDHHFVLYGMMGYSRWIVNGLENLAENVGEMQLQLRCTIESIPMKICALSAADFTSKRTRTSDVLYPEPTQGTPVGRWMTRRGETPATTPHVTPIRTSKEKGAEGMQHERRSKELLLHASKNLLQAISAPNVDNAFSLASPRSFMGTDQKSGTRKSQSVKPGQRRPVAPPRNKEKDR
ncbi:hypothetical protein Q1695_012551 [Nippostrongylus brasiliensis]|nr:hypothetical protein Q1695_012551 [Nippostrongylus brasiliensis]